MQQYKYILNCKICKYFQFGALTIALITCTIKTMTFIERGGQKHEDAHF